MRAFYRDARRNAGFFSAGNRGGNGAGRWPGAATELSRIRLISGLALGFSLIILRNSK